jgi:hypothetical protein
VWRKRRERKRESEKEKESESPGRIRKEFQELDMTI